MHPIMRTIVAAAALLLPTFGCSLGDVPPEDQPDEAADRVAGQYELTSTYNIAASEGVPGLIGDVIAPLAGLRDDPAGTIFEILEANGGAVADLIGLLPSNVRADVEREINDYVAEQVAAGGGAGDIIAWVDQIAGILTHFEVVSQFEIGRADESGVASANHSLAAVRFELDTGPQEVVVSELISTLTIARGVDCSINGSEISIAEHAFHLPLGDLAVVGFNKALEGSLGARNISEALGLVIDCADVVERIGPVCISSFCIDPAEIENLCTSGLDAIANEIEEQIAKIDFAELRLTGGRAALEDVAKQDGFGQIDQWAGGSWKTAIEIDGLRVPVDATFSASRM
jgi:hypothetical protein